MFNEGDRARSNFSTWVPCGEIILVGYDQWVIGYDGSMRLVDGNDFEDASLPPVDPDVRRLSASFITNSPSDIPPDTLYVRQMWKIVSYATQDRVMCFAHFVPAVIAAILDNPSLPDILHKWFVFPDRVELSLDPHTDTLLALEGGVAAQWEL